MKRLSYIFMMAASAATLLCSCSKAKTITPSSDSVTFAITGGEKSISVAADGNYNINECPEWVKAETTDTALIVSVGQNTTGAPRECTIKLVGDNVEVPIIIRQADKCTYITPAVSEVTFPKEGGTQEIAIDTDGANITVNCPEGVNASFADGKLTINAPTNQGGTIKGDITLSCDDVTNTVAVTVQGSICQRCNGKGKVKCTHCGGKGWIDLGGEDYKGCTACGGYGVCRMPTDYTPKLGSGKMTCPDCGGAGK
ncbi:MAG: hypothetical protein IKQ89_00815 [Muribaculaceae bacterium]|nr:hypothetical protein [Muribaculaceae bacterium]